LYELIFQGGTALSKAYSVTERMSEDCDFRICFKKTDKPPTSNQERKTLRQLHKMIYPSGRAVMMPL